MLNFQIATKVTYFGTTQSQQIASGMKIEDREMKREVIEKKN